MSSAIKTPAFQAKAGNIQNEDGSSIYSNGDWSLKNSSAVASVTITDDGKVGIGTDSPATNLDINGVNPIIRISDTQEYSAGSWTDGIPLGGLEFYTKDFSGIGPHIGAFVNAVTANTVGGQTTPSYALSFGTGLVNTPATERMRIDASGVVTLGSDTTTGYSKLRAGSTTPAYVWRNNPGTTLASLLVQRSNTIAGGHYFIGFESGATDVGLGGTFIGGIRRNSGNTAFEFFNTSDERLKDVKGEFDGAAEMVKGIPVKWYAWKTDPSKEHFRFIAQDVQKHIPSAVSEDENGHLMLGESDMFPVLWQAVREQQAMIEELKAKVSALESK